MRSTKFFLSILLYVNIHVAWSFQKTVEAHSEIVQRGDNDDNGWSCTTNAECTFLGEAWCYESRCVCDREYVFNAAMTACIKAANDYGDACNETSQCTKALYAGGLCNQGFCTCSKGFYYIYGRCHLAAGLNEACMWSYDCYVNADYGAYDCRNKVCDCADGYYHREYRTCRLEATKKDAECTIDLDCVYDTNAKCNKNFGCYVPSKNEILKSILQESKYPTARQAQPINYNNTVKTCSVNSDCGQYGYCLSKTCECYHEYFWDSTEQICVAELGRVCKTSDQPLIENSICRRGTWRCKGATVPSKNNQVCLEAVTDLDGYCQHDEQCYVLGPDASCKGNRCRCNENSHYSEYHKYCWANKALGKVCKDTEDCYSSFSKSAVICNDKSICTCSNGTHANADKTGCVKNVPIYGDPCTHHVDCKGLKNSICSNGTNGTNGYCSCDKSYFELSGNCVKGIGAQCTLNNSCQAKNSECISERCSCIDKHVLIDVKLCLPSVPVGDDCQLAVQCQAITNETFCDKNNKCNCHISHNYRDGKCYLKKYLGEKCNNSTDECRSLMPDEYDPKIMSCTVGQCRCKDGYSPALDGIKCSPHSSKSGASSTKLCSGWIAVIVIVATLETLLSIFYIYK